MFVYEFSDGSVYKLLDYGFSASDLWKLEEVHGKLVKQTRE